MRCRPVYSGKALRPITVIRAIQWIAIVVAAWSLAMPWGDELDVGKGPPSQWERHVVGAALLLLVAALTMTLTARNDEKPGGVALAIAGLASLGAIALALDLRSTALDRGHGHVLLGGGWMWMSAGACMAFGSVVSAFTLRFRPAKVGANKAGEISGKSAPPSARTINAKSNARGNAKSNAKKTKAKSKRKNR